MIKLALLGCGNRTKALLNTLRKDSFYSARAAFDLNKDAALKLTAEYGGTVCDTADELLDFPGTDAFLISLSPFAHAEALRQAIPMGKPIFVEKPVSFSSAEVKELSLLAEKYSVPVQVGFMRRYLPETQEALKYIKDNDPGKILYIEGTWLHPWDKEISIHPLDNFRFKMSQIPFHCCHMLDILMLMGGPVKRVSSRLVKEIERPYPNPNPDDLVAILEFANGANGMFHYSSMVYHNEISYCFNADNYSVRMNKGAFNVEVYPRPRFLSSHDQLCRPRILRHDTPGRYADENIMYDFVKTTRDGMPPTANLDVATRVQGLAEAIEKSGKLNHPIEIAPDGLPILKEC